MKIHKIRAQTASPPRWRFWSSLSSSSAAWMQNLLKFPLLCWSSTIPTPPSTPSPTQYSYPTTGRTSSPTRWSAADQLQQAQDQFLERYRINVTAENMYVHRDNYNSGIIYLMFFKCRHIKTTRSWCLMTSLQSITGTSKKPRRGKM